MASLNPLPGSVRFGSFELNLRTGELKRDGRRTRLQEQPAQLLVVLVSRSGELVTREELRAKLWPQDTFVDFDHGLNNAVNRIREALGDSAGSPCYIETMPRKGYRFIGETERIETGSEGSAAPADRSRPPAFLARAASGRVWVAWQEHKGLRTVSRVAAKCSD